MTLITDVVGEGDVLHASALKREEPRLIRPTANMRLSVVQAFMLYVGLLRLDLHPGERLSLWRVQCDQFLAQASTVGAVMAVATVFVPLSVIGHPLDGLAVGWYLANAVLLLGGAFLARRARGGAMGRRAIWRVMLSAGICCILIGLSWGMLILTLMPQASQFQLVLLSCIAAVMACAPALSLAVWPTIAILYAYSMLIPFAIALSQFAGDQDWLLGLGLVLFLPAYGIIIIRGYCVFLESELLRLDRERQSETIALLLHEFEDAASDWLWETDEGGYFRRVPRRMAEAAGRAASDLAGSRFDDIVVEYTCPEGRADSAGFLALLAAHEVVAGAVVPIATPRGTTWWRLSARPVFGAAGHFRGFRGVGSDITEEVRITQELSAARDAAQSALTTRSRFIATMSHELRTPLNAIIGFAELIADDRLGHENIDEYREFGNEIRESGLHLLSLINDILETSALEEGPPVLTERDMHADTVMRGAMRMVENRCRDRGISLRLSARDDIVLHADERRIRQILINLLSNASKFARQQINTSVHLSRHGEVLFTITDDGAGPPDMDSNAIFDPFVRGTPEENVMETGLGIGLAIAKRLANAHGGDLTLTRGALGGAVATLTIPADRVRPAAAMGRPASA